MVSIKEQYESAVKTLRDKLASIPNTDFRNTVEQNVSLMEAGVANYYSAASKDMVYEQALAFIKGQIKDIDDLLENDIRRGPY